MTTIEVAGALVERGDRALGQRCPLDRTLGILGNRSAVLLLREVFYGTHRFDALARRVGITEAVAARWLKGLVAAGVLAKTPYKEDGQRTRHEYVLTQAGHELMPVILGLIAWGAAHTEPPDASRVTLTHQDCGTSVHVELRCRAGHDVTDETVVVTAS